MEHGVWVMLDLIDRRETQRIGTYRKWVFCMCVSVLFKPETPCVCIYVVKLSLKLMFSIRVRLEEWLGLITCQLMIQL